MPTEPPPSTSANGPFETPNVSSPASPLPGAPSSKSGAAASGRPAGGRWSRSRLLPLAAGLALGLTMLLSVLALGVGSLALSAAHDAEESAERATAAASREEPAPAPPEPIAESAPSAPDPTDDPDPTPNDLPSNEPGDLKPSASYQLAYGDQKLRIQAGCNNREVDLDEPRVTPDTGSDLTYSGCSSGRLELSFNSEIRVSQMTTTKPSANECAEAIRSSAGNNAMAPSQNMTLCMLTSKAAATELGISQKIVLFRVDSIAKDGSLNVSATAWNVPA